MILDIPEAAGQLLTRPRVLNAGPYHARGVDGFGMQNFIVEFDAQPLATLLNEVACGSRIYEFLAIRRQGDLLHYLRVRPVDVQPAVMQRFSRKPHKATRSCGDGYLPAVKFDNSFYEQGDDTDPEDACWLTFREKHPWHERTADIFDCVKQLQTSLRKTADYLAAREIARIDAGIHPRDYQPDLPRINRVVSPIPQQGQWRPALFQAITELIVRETVQSISCPFDDYWLWRRLVEEQVRRAERTGQSQQAAFSLSTSDNDLEDVPFEDWGGKVHIPAEGACGADLFIRPNWRNTFPEYDSEGGSLSDVLFNGEIVSVGYVCHYLLTSADLGELNCASRRDVGGGWVLYESNRPYIPNPRLKDRS